ncbi:uncharacterized protein CDAR_298921 [Caerostris darwini]|uniref:Uncharacterized protein n=1 Tax=Caerostris darwini TaxID=1538125 RepID=A0AAV4PF98_9ARAC|nr:uncharacterized protein CDAR_298921 [Caerostris darwini]
MCTLKGELKTKLSGIRTALSQLTSLKERAIYLRKVSQENHVKRMQLARIRGVSPSPVFILPTSSPTRDVKSKPKEESLKKSPRKAVAIKDQCSNCHLAKKNVVSNQNRKQALRGKEKESSKIQPEDKVNKHNQKTSTQHELKSPNKPTSPLRLNSKSDTSEQNSFNKLNCNKHSKQTTEGKDLVRGPIDQIPINPCVSPKPEKIKSTINNSNKILTDFTKFSNSANLKDNLVGKSFKRGMLKVNLKGSQYKDETFQPDATNNFCQCPVNEIEKIEVKTSHSQKDPGKPNEEIFFKFVPKNPLLNQIGRKIQKTEDNDSLANKCKKQMPVNVNESTNFILNETMKKLSFLTNSISLDSLEACKKPLNSPAPDKARNNVCHKQDLKTSSPSSATKKQSLVLYNEHKTSKIPIHEFRLPKIRNQRKETEPPKLLYFRDMNFENKDRLFKERYTEDSDLIARIKPFQFKNSAVSTWLRTVPDTTKEPENNQKIIKQSEKFLTDSTVKKSIENSFLNSPKIYNTSNTGTNFFDVNNDISSTSLTSSFAFTETESDNRNSFGRTFANRIESSKDNMKGHISPITSSSNDFVSNPIEKFMKEINSMLCSNTTEQNETKTGHLKTNRVRKAAKTRRKSKKHSFKRKL